MKLSELKDKELAVTDWLEMISHAWTWVRLTPEEQQKFKKLLEHPCTKVVIKGSYEDRWDACEALYHTFLEGLDYDPLNWREQDPHPTVSIHYELNYSHHGFEYKPLTVTDEKHAKSLARTLKRDSSNENVTLTKVRIITTRMEVK